MKFLFWFSLFCIIHTFILYPISLKIISLFYKNKKVINRDEKYEPTVSLLVVAHNEEKVIKNKLENLMNLKYDSNKLEIIVSSDNSDDKTNSIVREFIENKNNKFSIKLYEVLERKGKTNAQNEAVKICNGEILVLTDANSMLDPNSVNELVKTLKDKNIGYVSGKLEYINSFENMTSNSENSYWNYDLMMRKYESLICSITAGNGALYAVRKSEYIDIDPIECHDSMYPIIFNLNNKKSKYNKNAIAYEKAGEITSDEFLRKVRMFRGNIKGTFSNFEKYNPFKVGWFSYFYLSHRAMRNLLWISHIVVFISNFMLINQVFYRNIFFIQVIFYILAILGIVIKNKIFYVPYYYSMTIFAQFKGAINELSGKSKATWEKAETTR